MAAHHGGLCLMQRVDHLRAESLPFATSKHAGTITEGALVTDLLRMLQGFQSHHLPWDDAAQAFYVQTGVRLPHVSQSSLYKLFTPFLAAASSLRRLDLFVAKVATAGCQQSPAQPFPTLQAFAHVVSMRLQFLRKAASEKELEAANSPAAGHSVTLLSVASDLFWVTSGAAFLEHAVMSAIPDYTGSSGKLFTAAELASHILSALYIELNKFCLIQDGGEQAYRTLLLLFVGSLQPLASSLHTWLHEGLLNDAAGELFFYTDGRVTVENDAFWLHGYTLRTHSAEVDFEETTQVTAKEPGQTSAHIFGTFTSFYLETVTPKARFAQKLSDKMDDFLHKSLQTNVGSQDIVCPVFLQPYAKAILSAGKSLQLLQFASRHVTQRHDEAVHLNDDETSIASSPKDWRVDGLLQQASLFEEFLLSLHRLVGEKALEFVQSVSTCEIQWLPGGKQLPFAKVEPGEGEFWDGRLNIARQNRLPALDGIKIWQNTSGAPFAAEEDTGWLTQLLPYPTLLPYYRDSFLLSEVTSTKVQDLLIPKVLNWFQDANLISSPSPAILMQECLLAATDRQVEVVGKQLLQRLMGEWHLMEELALLRTIYLVGCGDLLQQFSTVLFNKLDRGDSWDDYYELNTMLQESMRSSATEAALPALDSLFVDVDPLSTVPHEQAMATSQLLGRTVVHGIDTLDRMCFVYKVAWPLELIIDTNSIKRYNQVMSFLLKVKRAKHVLDKACRFTWKDGGGYAATNKRWLLLQHKLMHFVNTLHQYVMDRVLHSAWVELCEGMSLAGSLDEVIACHEAYLASLQRQCLIAPDKLWTLIASRVKTILGLALDFYHIQRSLSDDATAPAVPGRCNSDIERIGKQFDECMVFLLRVLSFKLNIGHFPHLADLVTRINFNFYYLSEDGHLLTPIPDSQQLRSVSVGRVQVMRPRSASRVELHSTFQV